MSGTQLHMGKTGGSTGTNQYQIKGQSAVDTQPPQSISQPDLLGQFDDSVESVKATQLSPGSTVVVRGHIAGSNRDSYQVLKIDRELKNYIVLSDGTKYRKGTLDRSTGGHYGNIYVLENPRHPNVIDRVTKYRHHNLRYNTNRKVAALLQQWSSTDDDTALIEAQKLIAVAATKLGITEPSDAL